MLTCPMDLPEKFPVRKSKKQKQSFREAVKSYVSALGYKCHEEKGSMGCRNLVIGDPDSAKYLVTAHYDTCAGMLFSNLITPCNFFTFLGYQILLTLFLLILPILPGIVVGVLTKDAHIGLYTWYACFWLILLLMLYGPANRHNANDNTSGVVTLLEIARTLPENRKENVCFVLFDLEEQGLVGSSSYRKAHKDATQKQIVLNLDCVGDGDEILFFPTGKLKKNEKIMRNLEKLACTCGEKSITVRKKGFSVYPSDQRNFPLGVGIAAFRRAKLIGLYCGRIHTRRDTVLDYTNVNILRAALTTLISGDAAK